MYLDASLWEILNYKKVIYGMAPNKILYLLSTPKKSNILVKDKIINIYLLLKIASKLGLEEVEAQ